MKNLIMGALLTALIAGMGFWILGKEKTKNTQPLPVEAAENEPVTPTPTPVTSSSNEIQVLKAIYNLDGTITPNKFETKVGKKIRFEILAKTDSEGCMGSFTVPDLTWDAVGFEKGQVSVLEVTPEKPGEYLLTCAMGIPHGVLKVN